MTEVSADATVHPARKRTPILNSLHNSRRKTAEPADNPNTVFSSTLKRSLSRAFTSNTNQVIKNPGREHTIVATNNRKKQESASINSFEKKNNQPPPSNALIAAVLNHMVQVTITDLINNIN